MADKTKTKKLMRHVGTISIIIAVLFLAFYLITILTKSSEFYAESAERNAKIAFDKDMINASELVEQHYDNLYEIVDRVKYATTTEEVVEVMSSYIGCEQFGDLRYYSQGVAHSGFPFMAGEFLQGGFNCRKSGIADGTSHINSSGLGGEMGEGGFVEFAGGDGTVILPDKSALTVRHRGGNRRITESGDDQRDTGRFEIGDQPFRIAAQGIAVGQHQYGIGGTFG